MSKPQGHVFTQESHPCGRLVVTADYDAAEQMIEFLVPSLSRGDRVYGVEIDALSGQCACGCEAFSVFRNAHRMPYRWQKEATYAEILARTQGKSLLPLITRKISGLCPHLRRARQWIQRHKLFLHFKQREQWLIELLEGKAAEELQGEFAKRTF